MNKYISSLDKIQPTIISKENEEIKCFKCNFGTIKQIPLKFYGFCNECPKNKTYYNFMELTPMQRIVLLSNKKMIILAGGMGTGKTDGDCFIAVWHMVQVSNAYVLLLALTADMAKRIIESHLYSHLPEEFIATKDDSDGRKDKTQTKITLINGSIIEIIPADKPEKYRSIEASLALVVEANLIQYKVVNELRGRIRSKAQQIVKKDKNNQIIYKKDENNIIRKEILREFGKIIIETNTDYTSWTFNKGILISSLITYTQNVRNTHNYLKINSKKQFDTLSIIASPVDNPYASKSFLKQMEGSDDLFTRQMLYGEFVPDGEQVWPEIESCQVNNVEHQYTWPHGCVIDWGTTTDDIAIWHWFLHPELKKAIIWQIDKLNKIALEDFNNYMLPFFKQYNYLYDKRIIDAAVFNKQSHKYIRGGLSIGEQLNTNYHMNLNKSIKDIPASEGMFSQLLKDKKIAFDTNGIGVLKAIQELLNVAYPKIDDPTKRGAIKTSAKPYNANENYDCARYFAGSIDGFWITRTAENILKQGLTYIQSPIAKNPRMNQIFGHNSNKTNNNKVGAINYKNFLGDK